MHARWHRVAHHRAIFTTAERDAYGRVVALASAQLVIHPHIHGKRAVNPIVPNQSLGQSVHPLAPGGVVEV
jgi:hypothetical protein